jgi:hypothetical protein
MPIPSWLRTIRGLLRNLSETVLSDTHLSDLHITFVEEDEGSIRPSAETGSVTNDFFIGSRYEGDVNCLPQDYQTRPEMVDTLSRWIASIHQLGARSRPYTLGVSSHFQKVEFKCPLYSSIYN